MLAIWDRNMLVVLQVPAARTFGGRPLAQAEREVSWRLAGVPVHHLPGALLPMGWSMKLKEAPKLESP